ncbi:hypothetical protein [Streptomyces sp. Je 1-332]|uniref:hypothetical protein n=1 Tax=Streptomyces sp. Je 1-332 TaxID=3231270 RepID=UPI00345A7F7A
MAIFMHVSLPGVTTEQYDTLNAKLQETPEVFDGCIAHVCVPGSDGLDIYDLWESERHAQAFSEKVAPVAESVGLTGPGGDSASYSAHNYWIPGA